MLDSAFDLGLEINNRKIQYTLYPPLWSRHDFSAINLDFSTWTTIKYLNTHATDFHPDISNVPNTTGGLYLFTIKCPIITGITQYPVYIGRAQFSSSQNLRKRCREYFTKYASSNERPKITKMFRFWGEYLYLSFLPLSTNSSIRDIEAQLINSLLLPFNTQIPDQEVRQAVDAF